MKEDLKEDSSLKDDSKSEEEAEKDCVQGSGQRDDRDHREEIDFLSEEFFAACQRELEERLSKKSRFEHSLGVAQCAQDLAYTYGLDEKSARIAGLLHDWDKAYDDEGIRKRVESLGLRVDPFVLEYMPRLLHGPTAAAALAQRFTQMPTEILNAIARHTTGAVDMSPLDMVVYIADVIEPNRDYVGVDALRDLVGRESLEELFVDISGHVLGNLIECKRLIHPQTLEVWNYYIARKRGSAHYGQA